MLQREGAGYPKFDNETFVDQWIECDSLTPLLSCSPDITQLDFPCKTTQKI